MSDDFRTEINLVARQVGLDQLLKQVRATQASIDSLTKSEALNEKEALQLTKINNKLEQSAKGVATGTAAQTSATTKATQAQQGLNTSLGQAANHLPRLRYALYDVSSSLAITGAAMVGLGTATVGTAIKMDRQFADVVRTTGTYLDETGQQTAALREEFNELFTSLPTTWTDLTKIGTLAGQLGVAKEDVAEFTKLVTMFASTTNVSVEQSATAFGRLSALLDVASSQYENLGSSILAVGVSSVATESQIINTSSQIASMGNFAGLTTDEVIGLSSSLASLGVQPELSRGTITRFFTLLTTAVSEGGAALDKFASAAGMSGEAFQKAWDTDKSDAIVMFLEGIQKQGYNAITALKEVGITASRDIPTLLKLAQNSGLVAEQFAIASQGFAEGTILQEQYGVIAETVASKLTVLRNNLVAVVGSLGESSSALGPLIDFLTGLVQAFDKIVSHPVGQVLALLVVGLTVFGGALALVTGLAARGTASLFAMATAANELAAANVGATITFKGLIAEMSALGSAGAVAAGAIRGVRLALISTGIGAVLAVIGTAVAAFVDQADNAEERMRTLKDTFSEAVEIDTAAFEAGEGAIKTYSRSLEDTITPSSESATAALELANELAGVKTDSDEAKESLENYTVAVGKAAEEAAKANIRDWLLGEGTGSEQLTRVQELQAGLAELGLSYEEFITAITTNDTKFLEGVMESADAAFAQGWKESGQAVDYHASATGRALIAVSALADEAMTESDALLQATYAAEAATSANELLGIQTSDTGEDLSGAVVSIQDFTEGIFDAINAEYALIGATYDLGTAIGTNGLDFSSTTAAGRANLAALTNTFEAASKSAGGDADLFASYVQEIIRQLVAAGVTGVNALLPVQAALASVAQSGGTPTVVTDMIAMNTLAGQISAGMGDVARETANTAKNARNAAKEIRTLSDYVSDLSKVFKDAFDFRFGFQQAKDDTTSAIRDIGESFADAREKVRDLRLEIQDIKATLAGLASDKATLEYQLSIAVLYGDTLRAQEIRAKLAQNSSDTAKAEADLTDTTKDLTKAQADSTATLTGNSEAAIAQREAVLNLVESIEEQILAYAAAGHSQAEVEAYAKKLKEQLEKQLKAWGYNNDEIATYTKSLDDVVDIIQKIPRNLTVEANANTDPAQKALDIFFSKNKNKKVTLDVGISSPSKNELDKVAKANRLIGLTAQLAVLNKALQSPTGTLGYYKALEKKINEINAKIKSGNYASGGFTGRGGKYTPAGVVHKGEYVVPQEHVNQSTGLPYADAFNRLAMGVQGPKGGGYASGGIVKGGPMQVELSPYDRRLLASAGNATLVADGRVLAQVVNNANANANSRSN